MLRTDFVPPVDPGFPEPGFPGDGFADPGVTGAFTGFFALVMLAVVIGIGFAIFVGVRKYMVIKNAGHDPLTVDAAMAVKVLDSDMLRPGIAARDAAPAQSIEQRLAEVDSLHARGVISDEERSAARAAILSR